MCKSCVNVLVCDMTFVLATTNRFYLFLKVAEIGHLDEEIMALHSEIVELQRSPYARRQGDVMEQL